MANLRISYVNEADSATITANPAADSTSPVTYLQTDARGMSFRSSSTASQEIFITWGGTAKTLSMAVLYGFRATDSATVRIQLYSDLAWTTEIYDSTALSVWAAGLFAGTSWGGAGFATYYFASTAGVKSAKITIADAANPDGRHTVGRLWLGSYVEAPYNPNYGMARSVVDGSAQNRNRRSGNLYVDVGARWRELAFDMCVETEADRAAWAEIAASVGINGSCWLSVFPTAGGTSERDFAMIGKFKDESPSDKMAVPNRYDFSMTFAEI